MPEFKHKPWYLEECSSTLASTYSSGTPGHDRSVATVDMDGRLRPDYICTVEHTGTSASAPLAAGIAALALEANPEITWRDMQYLVVLTSRAGPLEKEDGWALNGVKRKGESRAFGLSHKFGYGLMDAGAMVSLAEQWTNIPPQHICKSQEINEERQIDSSFGSVLTAHMDVNGCSGTLNEVRFLEHVQCKGTINIFGLNPQVSLRFFPRGNLKILLTSPMGMTSTLLFERPRDVVSSNFDDWPFLSVHYWGEKAEGRWTLQIINSGSRRVSQPGNPFMCVGLGAKPTVESVNQVTLSCILKKWQLIFYGTATSPIRLRSHGGVSFPSASVQQPVAQGPFMFPQTSAPSPAPAESGGFYGGSGDIFSNGGYQNFPNIYTAAGSDMQVSLAPLDSNNKSTSYQENLMSAEESNGGGLKKVSHICDPECDSQGCYGQSPSQCVACKHYKLDNKISTSSLSANRYNVCVCGYSACVSRCPPRSFPSQGGSCWPCHESCETCAGAGQDSCVTCAPAHMRLSDLSVCLQQCPEGYYESEFILPGV
uniref:P/Homo B domain-containing protein n=1 Tax=Timema bartmani TaxID=61472 RepID=A0A7R9ES92_9NEOP|nr:unnamed protein product [Timema bartmani]